MHGSDGPEEEFNPDVGSLPRSNKKYIIGIPHKRTVKVCRIDRVRRITVDLHTDEARVPAVEEWPKG